MSRIKDYDNFINESYVDFFNILFNKSPDSLKGFVVVTKTIEQSKKWHPEGNVFVHTRLVTNRLHNCYGDINLSLAGYFHDLGKIKTTDWDENKESWTAHGHEEESSKIAEQYKEWIEKQGANFKIVNYIIKNHMRIKYLDEFRFQEKMKFVNDPLFDFVVKFESADYGGTDLDCKPMRDMSVIEDEIYHYNKKIKEDKIISSKFNGKILMDLYPELKGKKLGDVITAFKHQFDDFREYVLNNTKTIILKDFDKFYKNN